MSEPLYDLAVIFFRGQIVHHGHLAAVLKGHEVAKNTLVFLGSHEEPRRADILPFTTSERRKMLLMSLPPELAARTKVVGIHDFQNDNLWVSEAQRLVSTHFPDAEKIALVGHAKDGTSYYLSKFSFWDSVSIPNIKGLSATPMRMDYFLRSKTAFFAAAHEKMPQGTIDFLNEFHGTTPYHALRHELQEVINEQKQWDSAPFVPVTVTMDAAFFHSGHVLLGKRVGPRGAGQWSLIGGSLLPQDETLLKGAVRKLREAAGVDVPAAKLLGSVAGSCIMDNPRRSMRGRSVTHAFAFNMAPFVPERREGEAEADYQKRLTKGLRPPMSKADGVQYSETRWWKLKSITRDMMFEDHFYIIERLKNL